MKSLFPNQRGFAPALIILVLAALGLTGVSTATLANNSKPGDILFGLDKTLEELKVVIANDTTKAKVRLEIADERLEELEILANTNQPVDPAVNETQLAINNATATLGNVEIKFKENKITLTSTDLQALLEKLQELLTTYQGLIRKVEVKIEDGEIKAKIKLFKKEASEAAELAEDDLDDLEDDDLLNASIAKKLEIELKGLLSQAGSVFQLVTGGKTYTLTAAAGVNLSDFVGKLVELEGFAQSSSPTQVTVLKVELEDDEEEEDEEIEVKGPPEVEARGFVRKTGGVFLLSTNSQTLFTLTSTKLNLNSFVDKFVKVEGTLQGNTLGVSEIEVKKTSGGEPVSPALSTSGPSGDDNDEDDDDDSKDNSGSSGFGSSGSNGGSNSSGEDND